MAVQYRFVLASLEVGDIYRLLFDLHREARAAAAQFRSGPQKRRALKFSQDLAILTSDFSRRLDRLAVQTAQGADKRIKGLIDARRKRAFTAGRQGLHLRDAIVSRPLRAALPTGAVGIADIAILDSVVNPRDPTRQPYWRSIEYGLDHRGRILRGFFSPPPTAPDAAQAGGGRQPFFTMSGVAGGIGVVQHPIKPVKFLEQGGRKAAVQWQTQMAVINRDLTRRVNRLRLRELPAMVTPVPGGRRRR